MTGIYHLDKKSLWMLISSLSAMVMVVFILGLSVGLSIQHNQSPPIVAIESGKETNQRETSENPSAESQNKTKLSLQVKDEPISAISK